MGSDTIPSHGVSLGDLPPPASSRNTEEEKNRVSRKKKKKRARCALPSCRKKTPLVNMLCRCNKRYCMKHRLPEVHACPVDYKVYELDVFMKKAGLLLCRPTKVSII